jgi:AraC-like DNA-binding protein
MDSVLGARCAIAPRHGTAFEASMGVLAGSAATLIEVSGSPYTSTRPGPGKPGRVSILLQLEGFGIVRDGHRTARLAPGDACVIPPDRGMVAERASVFRQAIVDLCAEDADALTPGWRKADTRVLPGQVPSLRAACDLVRCVLDHHRVLDVHRREALTGAATELLATTLHAAQGDEPRAGRDAGASRLAAYHRQRADEFIRAHLHDGQLSVAMIARGLNLSPRYVHKLYQTGRTSVMRRVAELRLDACRAELAAHDGRSIGAIAYAWGFSSNAHFSRAFRKRFGLRPSEV